MRTIYSDLQQSAAIRRNRALRRARSAKWQLGRLAGYRDGELYWLLPEGLRSAGIGPERERAYVTERLRGEIAYQIGVAREAHRNWRVYASRNRSLRGEG